MTDKQLVETYIHRYVNAGEKLNLRSYSRTMRWVNGMTFKQIGEEDGATPQAVGFTIKRTVERIKAFAKSN